MGPRQRVRSDAGVRAVWRCDVVRLVAVVEVVRLGGTLAEALGADDGRGVRWRTRENGASWKAVGKLNRRRSICGFGVQLKGGGAGTGRVAHRSACRHIRTWCEDASSSSERGSVRTAWQGVLSS